MHVPLPFTHEGVLSLLAIFVFNEIGYLVSPQRYPEEGTDIMEPCIPSRVEMVECRRLSRRIQMFLSHHFKLCEDGKQISLKSAVDQFSANMLQSISILRNSFEEDYEEEGEQSLHPTVDELKRNFTSHLLEHEELNIIHQAIEESDQGHMGWTGGELRMEKLSEPPDENLDLDLLLAECSGLLQSGDDGFNGNIQAFVDAARANFEMSMLH